MKPLGAREGYSKAYLDRLTVYPDIRKAYECRHWANISAHSHTVGSFRIHTVRDTGRRIFFLRLPTANRKGDIVIGVSV